MEKYKEYSEELYTEMCQDTDIKYDNDNVQEELEQEFDNELDCGF